jgi:hypothetical protein
MDTDTLDYHWRSAWQCRVLCARELAGVAGKESLAVQVPARTVRARARCFRTIRNSRGYFIGPLRGPIPVAAGIAGMPQVQFHIASVFAAVIWALTVVAPGAILHQSFEPNNPILLLVPLIMPVVIIGIAGGIVMLRHVLRRNNTQCLRRSFNRLVKARASKL